MKRNSSKTLVTAVVSAASLMIAFSVSASNTPQTGIQLTASATELPAQAASLVAAASADQRESVTKSVVMQALTQRPTVAASVVGAIAKSSPDMAAVAAVTAAVQQPSQIGQITKAAVSAAPQQAGKIVFAICQKFPTQFNLVAMIATQSAPQAGKEILAAVSSAVPSVKMYIDQSKSTTITGVIIDAQNAVVAAAQSANTTPDKVLLATTMTPMTPNRVDPPPTVGAAFQPVSNPTPAEINSGSTGVYAPNQGHDYSGN